MLLLHFVFSLQIMIAPAKAQMNKVVFSTDGVMRATVWTDISGESRVEIRDRFKGIFLTVDQTSRDGAHGYSVGHASWTADSQFFAFGTEATGGHQPWAHPIWIYSRGKDRLFELSKLGATAVSDFTLKSPDVIEVKILACGHERSGPQSRALVLPLRQLISADRITHKTCPPS